MPATTLHIRDLGLTSYNDALVLQRALCSGTNDNYMLLCEHDDVITLGRHANEKFLLDTGDTPVVRVERGGEATWHGRGQLVGYPVVNLEEAVGDKTRSSQWVFQIEELLITSLTSLGLLDCSRSERGRGVWCNGRKIASVGVRVASGRSMHGFSLNVSNDSSGFSKIIPCGITDVEMTNLHLEGIEASMSQVSDAICAHIGLLFPGKNMDVHRASSSYRVPRSTLEVVRRNKGDLSATGLSISTRKPEWLKKNLQEDGAYLATRSSLSKRGLVTVCEEAGCPNLRECWSQGTATFMINGASCTRNCGFCLVDTSRPLALDPMEPAKVAAAVAEMGLEYVVVTAVARDDLDDGGASAFCEVIEAVRASTPSCLIEVLIPDFQGNTDALERVFNARPDVLNHNVETVLRLTGAVRSRATYTRSLSVLAMAKKAGLVTKSGVMMGLGETDEEIVECLRDLANVGVDVVTLGQYLRPSSEHLPVARWVHPTIFSQMAEDGVNLGIGHVEAGPFVRSSYHAKDSHYVAVELRTARSAALAPASF